MKKNISPKVWVISAGFVATALVVVGTAWLIKVRSGRGFISYGTLHRPDEPASRLLCDGGSVLSKLS